MFIYTNGLLLDQLFCKLVNTYNYIKLSSYNKTQILSQIKLVCSKLDRKETEILEEDRKNRIPSDIK